MVSFNTDKGPVSVEFQSEDFYLCSQPAGGGHIRKVYVAALFPSEAAKKAIRFWYGRDPEYINR